MALSNVQIDQILREYDDVRREERDALDRRREYVYANVDGYRDLDHKAGMIAVSYAERLFSGEPGAKEKMDAEIATVARDKKALLVSAGLSEDYLEMQYHCPLCKDTGYIDNREKCRCLKEKELNILYSQSKIQNMLRRENFETLSYEFFEGQQLEEYQKTVEVSKTFVDQFDRKYQNLMFIGTVGCGKTF